MTREEYISGTGGLKDFNYSGPIKKGVSYLGSKKSNRKQRLKFLDALTPEVEALFLKYPTEADSFTPDCDFDLTKNYFVYDICSSDGKILFVEKSNDPNFEFNYKLDSLISFLSEQISFSLRRLISGLNEFQAYVYIHSIIMEYATKGEYLLNYYYFDITKPEVRCPKVTGNEPAFVFKNLAIKRFLPDIYEKEEKFDIINEDNLSHVTFHSKQRLEISEWLNAFGAKVTKTCTNNTKGIIVDNWIDYIHFAKYKKMGKAVLAVNDVLEYIKKHPITKPVSKKPVKVPVYDVALRDEIRKYLKDNGTLLLEYDNYVKTHTHNIDSWVHPFNCEVLKKAIPSQNAKQSLTEVIHAFLIVKSDPRRFNDLIKVYMKLGLFEEIVDFLSGIKDLAGAELVKYELIAESDRQK